MSDESGARQRLAARVLVIDDDGRLLLLKARQPDTGHEFWLAPGGGLEDGETFEAAAARELLEETGLVAPLAACVWTRRHLHLWDGRLIDQHERFFVVRTQDTAVRPQRPDTYALDHRWWTLDEIVASRDDFAPRRLRELLPPVLQGIFPAAPCDCGE